MVLRWAIQKRRRKGDEDDDDDDYDEAERVRQK